jgi:hypothetical protein
MGFWCRPGRSLAWAGLVEVVRGSHGETHRHGHTSEPPLTVVRLDGFLPG